MSEIAVRRSKLRCLSPMFERNMYNKYIQTSKCYSSAPMFELRYWNLILKSDIELRYWTLILNSDIELQCLNDLFKHWSVHTSATEIWRGIVDELVRLYAPSIVFYKAIKAFLVSKVSFEILFVWTKCISINCFSLSLHYTWNNC